MARPPRDPSLLSWPWGSAPSGSGGPSSAVGLTSLPIVNSHAESAAMLSAPVSTCGLNEELEQVQHETDALSAAAILGTWQFNNMF